MDENKCLAGPVCDPEIKSDKEAQNLLQALHLDSEHRHRHILLLLKGNYIGQADAFGQQLLNKLLEAAAASDTLPAEIILLDSAVLLACTGQEALGSLCRMEAMGTEIHICRHSAEKYLCQEKLCCGRLSGMEEIWLLAAGADKVISI